jgi:type I restriction enzyme S subunit
VKSGRIEDITSAIIDYRGRTPPKSSSGIKLLTAKVIKDGTIVENRLEYISEETYLWWMRRGFPQQWDILLTTEAPLGEVSLLRTPEPVALAQRVILLRGNPAIVDQFYLFAALRSPLMQDRLRQRSTGTTVLGIKQRELRKVEVPLPPLQTQRKIAAVLSAYDDLIENNNRRIKILEEMAQRIFREWFVDFRYPGHKGVPLVNSDMGPMPKGWRVARMDEIADVVDCLHTKKPSAVEDGEGILLQLFNIGSGGVIEVSQFYRISAADYEEWSSRIELHEGDCVITNVGRVAAVGQIPRGLKAVAGRNMTAVRPRSVPPTYLLQYLLSEHMEHEVRKKGDSGSIMDALNVKGIVRLSVPVPTHDLVLRFEERCRPLRRSMELIVVQQRNLRETRDLLLPRLISGEVDVTDLDVAMPEAAA